MRLSTPGIWDTLTVKWSVAERKNSLRKRTITWGHLEDLVDQMLTTDMLSQWNSKRFPVNSLDHKRQATHMGNNSFHWID